MLFCTSIVCAAANNEMNAAIMGGEVEVCGGENGVIFDCRWLEIEETSFNISGYVK
jgi:hypothetical protein